MYLTFAIAAGVGAMLAAVSALTALVRSIAERRDNTIHKPVILQSR